MTVGENIKRIRREKGLTQKKLGELCGINEVQIRRYELGGKNANPKIETLHKIASGLEVSIILLIEGCEDKYPLNTEDYQIDIYNSMTDDEKKLFAQHGEFAVRTDKKAEFITLSDKEKYLECYNNLNTLGKKEAVKRVQELTEIPRYTAPDEPS